MSTIVFDIETLALPMESFDPAQREYLLKGAASEEERAAELQKMSLHPFTARIVAIGMLNPDTMAGKVFYQAGVGAPPEARDGIEYITGDEQAVIEGFWKTVRQFDRIVTFNGRGFDCPFILLRSALLRIPPTRNLLPYRYGAEEHCDLLDQFTFYGSTRRFSLDFYCRSFGIGSPKEGGVTGAEIGSLFAAGRYRQIADYCMGDVVATAELFKRWNDFLNFKEPRRS